MNLAALPGADRWNLESESNAGVMVLRMRPKMLDGIAIHAGEWYDTTLATVVDQRIEPNESDGWSRLPPAAPGSLFCALSSAEYHAVCLTQQMPATAKPVADPMLALSTHWPEMMTFTHPAILVQVTEPQPARGGGLTSVVTAVHVGRPYRITSGQVALHQVADEWVEGDRQSPAAWVVWKRVNPGTPIFTEIALRGTERSGNWGHKGRPGERGGSAVSDFVSSASDALHSILNGEKVNIAKEDVLDFLEKARNQSEDPDLTDVHVEGMLIFGGNGLGIKRENMPQIPPEHRERFLEKLESKGVTVKSELVSPLDLAPTQKEISARNVGEKLKKYDDDPDREFKPLLVDQNNKVLDGHHHWGLMAAVAIANPDVKVPIRRIMLPNKKALEMMHEYDRENGIVRKAINLGGAGSGNFGHAGRPGEIGGSAADGGGDSKGAITTKGHGDTLKVPVSASPDLGKERPTPIKVETVHDAVAAILKGKVVELKEVGQVHTVLIRLAAMVKEAEDRYGKDQKEVSFDLCNVSVSGSNLFCGSALKTKEFPNGVPRIEMPQFKGFAHEGTPAATLEKITKEGKDYGKVDVTQAFVNRLKGAGIALKSETVKAESLKATQSQLGGSTVAGMMANAKYDPAAEAIFVSRDGYVLDGHHRWAATVARDAADGRLGESTMNVIRIDAPMSELLHRANHFTDEVGMKKAAVKLRSYAERVFALVGHDARYLQ